MGPGGSHNVKTLLLPQIIFESFQKLFLNVLLSGPHKKYCFDFLKC